MPQNAFVMLTCISSQSIRIAFLCDENNTSHIALSDAMQYGCNIICMDELLPWSPISVQYSARLYSSAFFLKPDWMKDEVYEWKPVDWFLIKSSHEPCTWRLGLALIINSRRTAISRQISKVVSKNGWSIKLNSQQFCIYFTISATPTDGLVPLHLQAQCEL